MKLCKYGCGLIAVFPPEKPSRCGKSANSCPATRKRKSESRLRILETSKEEILDKCRRTNLERFGVENASQSDIVKQRMKETNLERFGVENASQSDIVKKKKAETSQNHYGTHHPAQSDIVKQRMKETNLERFGVENASQAVKVKEKISEKLKNADLQKSIRLKMKATCLQKYGVENPAVLELTKLKSRETSLRKYGVAHFIQSSRGRRIVQRPKLPQAIIEKITSEEFWKEEYCNKQRSIDQIAAELGINAAGASNYFWKYSNLELRGFANQGSSAEERSFIDFIDSLELKTIARLSFQKLAKMVGKISESRKEIDVYLPDFKLAFEYNGLYWHSELHQKPEYHHEKTLECERLGIRLIHIWSDDWLLKRTLLEKKIRAFVGLEKERVFARKCSILIPTSQQKKSFYETNHIKGDGAGSITYALQNGGALVAMLTLKSMGNGSYDLNRYATSCSVVGGFSKLLEHFKRKVNWKRIYTFADGCWSRGELYLKTGFSLVGEIPPSFHGFENFRDFRINRLNYTHDKLSKRFPHLSGTQKEIMDQAGILRIWDCGQLKFELVKI
jgi:hypothetical protein